MRAIVAILIALLTPLYAIGQTTAEKHYTEENPLVYEDAWDLWPYVFLNEHGEPEGFNVDMLKELFRVLNIPFEIKLKSTADALEDLRAGRSDLMMRLGATFHDDYAYYGKEVVQLFTHSVVSPKSKPLSVRTMDDLGGHQVIVHSGSLSHRRLVEGGWGKNVVPYDDMKEAIQKVSTEDEGLIVWNTMSLKWLMKKFQTDNLQITPLDVQHGEYKFYSMDTVLLHKLDSAYAILCSTDRILPIQNKWFYPERVDTGVPGWVKYVVTIIGLLVFLLAYYVIVLHLRERKMSHLIEKHNKRMALTLRMTKVRVWLWDVVRQKVIWMNADGEMEKEEHLLSEYERDYTPESFGQMKEVMRQMIDGSKSNIVQELIGAGRQRGREYVLTLSVFRRSKRGRPLMLVGMLDDQTERLIAQRKAKDNMLRYQSIFSTSMVDMTYYNPDGFLSDINEKACQTFNCSREDMLAERPPFYYALEDNSLTIEQFEGSYTTHIIQAVGNENMSKSINVSNKIYYEQQLLPIRDANNRLLGIFGSGRDVSEFVNSYHQLCKKIDQLKSAARDVTEYMGNINFALHVGGGRLADYSPDTHILTIYKEMNVIQLSLTQSRCLSLVDDSSKRLAMRFMNSMDMRSDDSIDAEIKTVVRIPGNQVLSLQFHLLPVFGERGMVNHYFGLCRDVSQQKATEERLEREKSKAQEVENVKNVFLRNMSHEIRTPIATVVGFARLFMEEHNPADEEGFIEEIKKNANYLLSLVNDVLFLSRLDAHMIDFNKAPIDLAYTFEGHCQMGWAKLMNSNVKYVVENPYEHLMVEIDDSNVGRVIEQLAANAARCTDSGTVRARYDYIGGKLLITVDDTGCGVAAERQESVFERFSMSGDDRGTGLGMPICKELTEQMGGSVYINSAAGKGTTVWVVLPCKATLIKKK